MKTIRLLSTVLTFTCIFCDSKKRDPFIKNNGKNSVLLEIPLPETNIECRLGGVNKTVCPEVWKPVCGEDNVTYWNCCFHEVYSNSTSYKNGKCDENDDDSDLFIPMNISQYIAAPGSFPVADDNLSSSASLPSPTINLRKLLQTSLSPFDALLHLAVDDPSYIDLGFEAVIADNELLTLQSTKLYPFYTIGRFSNLGCSGFLIGDNQVLTAAHCVWNLQTKDWFTELDFTPGQNGVNSAPFGTFDWDYAYIPWQFAENEDMDYDFALVILKGSFMQACSQAGISNCWFLRYATECLDRSFVFNIAGYREDESSFGSAERVWVSPCRDIQVDCTGRTFLHTCDTTSGMSGAPLWVFRKGENNNPPEHSVRGIHTGEDITTGQPTNRAVLLNQENYDRIQGWVADALGRS